MSSSWRAGLLPPPRPYPHSQLYPHQYPRLHSQRAATTPEERRAHKQQYRRTAAPTAASSMYERSDPHSSSASHHSLDLFQHIFDSERTATLGHLEEVIHTTRVWHLDLLLEPVQLSGSASSTSQRIVQQGSVLPPRRQSAEHKDSELSSWTPTSPLLGARFLDTRTGSTRPVVASSYSDGPPDNGSGSPSFTPTSPPYMRTPSQKTDSYPARPVSPLSLNEAPASPSYSPSSPPPLDDPSVLRLDGIKIKREGSPTTKETEMSWLNWKWPDQQQKTMR